MHVEQQVPLAPRTTLQLGGPAEFFCDATDVAHVLSAVAWASQRQLPLTLLSGGSNTVVADAGVPGLTVALSLAGTTFEASGEHTRVAAMAGESFDALVAETVRRNLGGLECLSGIPGSVGATPVQNVGAYGQEVADVIEAVEALDRETGARVRLAAADCEFAYRDSVFKRTPGRYIVLSVTYRLRSGAAPCLRYAELERSLQAASPSHGGEPTLAATRQAVLALRRGKSMLIEADDDNRRSVGSFFTNPIVAESEADRIVDQALRTGLVAEGGAVPRYPTGQGSCKLSAAWLIERAGVQRGLRRGAVGVSSRHTLALVHHGGGTTEALCELARELRDRVEARFAVRLAPEPVFVGFPQAPV